MRKKSLISYCSPAEMSPVYLVLLIHCLMYQYVVNTQYLAVFTAALHLLRCITDN